MAATLLDAGLVAIMGGRAAGACSANIAAVSTRSSLPLAFERALTVAKSNLA